MAPESYVAKYFSHAKKAEKQTGVPALFALAQSALESGWGKSSPGNMLFGVKVGGGKSFGGWQQDQQLITTTEYGDTPNLKFPYIYPGYPAKEGTKWKYIVKDYFRAYPSPLNTFLDWAGMLSQAGRYAKAMQNRTNPYRFAEEVVKAGYATDPAYVAKVTGIMNQIAGFVTQQERNLKLWRGVILALVIGGMVLAGYGAVKYLKGKKK